MLKDILIATWEGVLIGAVACAAIWIAAGLAMGVVGALILLLL